MLVPESLLGWLLRFCDMERVFQYQYDTVFDDLQG